MINYKRPPKPRDFPTLKIQEAFLNVSKRIMAKMDVKSKDFHPHWGDYKNDFVTYQGNGKCGFCETRVSASSPGGVDHFRPKTEVVYLVDDEEKKSGRDRARKQTTKIKPGYWRLAYDWYNWIFVCENCNSSWKKNQFPTDPENHIIDKRTSRTEKRLLLNPFVDKKIGANFNYEFNGKIAGVTEEGRVTIHVCGLDRSDLVYERELLAARILDHINDVKMAVGMRSIELYRASLRNLHSLSLQNMQYAGMVRHFVNEHKNSVGFNWSGLNKKAVAGQLISLQFTDRDFL